MTIEGLTLAQGVAAFGGAIAVESGGNLTLRNCAVVDSLAMQYGGEVTIRTEDHWFVLTVLLPR